MAGTEAVTRAVREAIAAGALWREQLALVVRAVNDAGKAAFETSDYAAVSQINQRAEALQALCREADALEERIHAVLDELAPPAPALGEPSGTYLPQVSPPGERGRRTPEQAFRVPILRALVDAGGRARAEDVLASVHAAVQDKLVPRDLEPVASKPRTARWRNTAQWCRNRLRKEGLLSADSPRGVWEITAEGRRWLEEQGGAT